MRYIENVYNPYFHELDAALKRRRTWGTWLSKQHWQLFGTLTFASNVTIAYAMHAAYRWAESLGLGVYAWIAIEQGRAGNRAHAHVLVGGAYYGRAQHSSSPAGPTLDHARRQWALGDSQIEKYKPWLGGAWYCSKSIDEWDIVGHMRQHRNRRYRRRIRYVYEYRTRQRRENSWEYLPLWWNATSNDAPNSSSRPTQLASPRSSDETVPI